MQPALVWLGLVTLASRASADCRTVAKCCLGKSSDCYSHGPRLSGHGGNTTKCFCDEGCLRLLDCCTDMAEACPPQACRVSVWSEWSACGCGNSKQTRTRQISANATFGGADCPPLQEHKSCWVRSCKRRRNLHRNKETALLLPSSFREIRDKYNLRKHYNWNLYKKYWIGSNDIPDTSSCGSYELQTTNHGCGRQAWTSHLKPGARICVECHPSAVRYGHRCHGHGSPSRTTSWSALHVRACRGTWRLTTEHKACSCNPQGINEFIFV